MTIVAISTAVGGAGGIGIIRLSGEKALEIAQKVFFIKGKSIENPEPNKMHLGILQGNGIKEKAFCVFYKAPHSFTGEDVVELQCHGGVRLLAEIVKLLVENGAIPATRGEFTKRAFLNRKMTLSEAEGVADMIEAETAAELNQAYRLMSGATGKEIEQATELLLKAAANLEVALDYPDEIDEDTYGEARVFLEKAAEILQQMLKNSEKRRLVKEGATIVIAGEPNVGKSSLLNAILHEDRAIVTDIAGTTRDTLTESVEVDGVRLNFVDTAGLRTTDNKVEAIGVSRAETAIAGADLVLEMIDLSQKEDVADIPTNGKKLLVGNKSDIKNSEIKVDVMVSAKTGDGIDALLARIIKELDAENVTRTNIVMKERHISAIMTALGLLNSALREYKNTTSDCLLVDIKAACDELMRIQGKNVSAEVIDDIFNRFCVGK